MDDDHDDGDGHGDDQVLKLGKEEREKQNLSSAENAVQAKAIADIPVVCDFPDVFPMICLDYPRIGKWS